MDPVKKFWLNLLARERYRKINQSLFRRALAGLGVNDYGPRQKKGEERFLERLLKELPPAAVVFDIGAHHGTYASFLASRRPDLIIHAFEPNPVAYKQLVAQKAKNVSAHPFALGDREGPGILHDPKESGGSECASLVARAVDNLYASEIKRTVPVEIRRLDRMVQTLGLTRIDYLKIDAEGYDLMVLRGAEPLLKENRIGIIQFEFNKMNVFSRSFMHDFYQLLPRHEFHRILQDGLLPLGAYNPVTWELFGYQNIVALPKSAPDGNGST